MDKDLEYEIIHFWNDQDDLYVEYKVTNKNDNTKVHTVDYYNTSDISDNYNEATKDEIEDTLLKLLKENKGLEFNYPHISEVSPLLKYVYDYVCDSEANMCHIDDEDWKELKEENDFEDKDIVLLEQEIKKYNLEDYITIDSDGYKICGYGGLQCLFDDDTLERTDEFER